MAHSSQKIVPSLWFDKNCEEAMEFYTSTFKHAKIVSIRRYPEGATEGPMAGMDGKVLTGIFELEGCTFMALDGGPVFTPNPSISFFVNCDSKEEVDELWGKLAEGGKVLMALDKYPFSDYYGWAQDKFGVSWQLIVAKPEGDKRPKIVPSMLFVQQNAGKAEEAMEYYLSIFKDAEPGNIFRYEAGQEPDKPGTVAYEDFMLEGQWFAAMDSAREHDYTFNEAMSFVVNCKDQAEIDTLWEKLSAVPASEQCGWLKDKYGVSWQIIPANMGELLDSQTALDAMLQMKKIDIAALQQAGEQ